MRHMNNDVAKQNNTLREWLAAEPFTLTMSSGFFGFYAHAGMLCALDAAGIKPSAIRGSSAGALIGGMYGSGRSPSDIADILFSLKRDDFWDPGLGLGLLRGKRFRAMLRAHLDAQTFEDSAMPMALSVLELMTRATKVIESGDLAWAIHASCAFPFLIQPVRRGIHLYSDGGIADRPALLGAKPNERIFYHHLAARSPWRKRSSEAIRMPVRDNLLGLQIMDLPRVGPFNLETGRLAFDHARHATQQALKRPVGRSITVDGSG